ncbi:Ferric uptake regulation protein [bacterium HR26]|nr:Ferric uptake regulation protein [bacterium HR26]
MALAEAEIIARIQEHGLRVTQPRRLIIRAVLSRTGPFSAEELWSQLQRHGHAAGRATVFRTLDLLVELGVLDRVHHPSGLHRYVLAGDDHRHHVVCSRCGAVADFNGCNVEELIAAAIAQTGFQIDGHWLELFGICAACRDDSQATRSPVAIA